VSLGVLLACGLAIVSLGSSSTEPDPVWRTIADRLPATIELVLVALVAAVALGAFAGFIRAIPRFGALREIVALPPLVVRAIPVLVLAQALQLALIFWSHFSPAGISSGDSFDIGDRIAHLAVPALMLAIPFGAWASQIFYDGFRQPNSALRTPLHRFGSSLATTAASIGPALLSASLLVEVVTAWPGIGRLFFNGLSQSDFRIIAGVLLAYAACVVLLRVGAVLVPPADDTPSAIRSSRFSATGVVAIVLLAAGALGAVAANAIAPIGPYFIDVAHWQGYPLAPGAGGHPLGTDENGRDLLARLLFGLRMSLGIAAFATLVAAAFAAVVARAVPRFGDRAALSVAGIRAFAALPFVMAAVLILAHRFGIGHVLSPVALALIIAATAWPALVPAFRQVTRATLGVVVAVAGAALLLEVTLSMMGWGVQPPEPSLGNMLVLMQSNASTAPWAVLAPAIVATVMLFALYAIADDLRESA
jgi:peptide/nickel transport system permease protein